MLATLTTLWLLHLAALLTPGANVLLVSQAAVVAGRKVSSYAATGIAIGTLVWSGAAVLGVATMFAAAPAARLLLQAAGGAYLLHLAWRMGRTEARAAAGADSRSPAQALRAGLLTSLSNPKSVLFFGSVFAAALPKQPSTAMLACAVALVVFDDLFCLLALACLFSRSRVQAAYDSRRGPASLVSAAVLGALGATLLATTLQEARRPGPARSASQALAVSAEAQHPWADLPAQLRAIPSKTLP